jgi:hypothetical protein
MHEDELSGIRRYHPFFDRMDGKAVTYSYDVGLTSKVGINGLP